MTGQQRILRRATQAVIAAVVLCFFAVNPSIAVAENLPGPIAALEVSAQQGLSLVSEPEILAVTIPSALLGSLPPAVSPETPGVEDPTGPRIIVSVRGPVSIAQIGQDVSSVEAVGTVSQALDMSQRPAGESWVCTVEIPAVLIKTPGAYCAQVTLVTGTTVVGKESVWLGKAAAPAQAVAVACVWPLALGIHRDPQGVYFDEAWETALLPGSEGPSPLGALGGLAEQFPLWQFTLGVEPATVSQLRDLSDGYVRANAEDSLEEIGADQQTPQAAAQVLSALQEAANTEEVEVVVTPYASPTSGALTQNGCWEELVQIQLGKKVVAQALSLSKTVFGAYAPGLDISTKDLAAYGRASIDYVLVAESVSADLAEHLPAGTVAVRARDQDNQRVTLVFVDDALCDLMQPPWRVDFFCAGLAAALASNPRQAVVLMPRVEYGLVPAAYLQAVGEILTRATWLRTCTVANLIKEQLSDVRPLLLNRAPAVEVGYVAREMDRAVAEAHEAVEVLVGAADSTAEPVERAQLMLYAAQSRWWSLPRVSPEVADVGLQYAKEARKVAEAELAKIGAIESSSWRVRGGEGEVTLVVENGATYSARVEICLAGEGLSFPEGDKREVELSPGRSEVKIQVANVEKSACVEATLVAGDHVLDRAAVSLGSAGLSAVLPWAAGGIAILAVAAGAVGIRRRAHHEKPE